MIPLEYIEILHSRSSTGFGNRKIAEKRFFKLLPQLRLTDKSATYGTVSVTAFEGNFSGLVLLTLETDTYIKPPYISSGVTMITDKLARNFRESSPNQRKRAILKLVKL